MARSKSSGQWLKEHESDEFVRRARQEGYRSRAVYKLLEIDQRDHLFKPGMTVIDLGAAPGSWSQVAVDKVTVKGKVVALDILPMEPLPEVEFIQGDFREQEVMDRLLERVEKRGVDLVISDIAPNMSGMGAMDQPRSMYLVELALDTARQVLRPGGVFLVKLFQGSGSEQFIRDVRSSFKTVVIRKPKASRARSREVYILARDFKI